MIDTAALKAESLDRMGDVLQALGAKVIGSAARGRAAASWRGSKDLNLSYGNGFVTDHPSGESFDALGIVAHVHGLDLRRGADLREAADILAGILDVRVDEEAPRRSAERPRRAVPAIVRPEVPVRHAAALWARLVLRDAIGEKYLLRRKLILGEPLGDLVRFNNGTSGDAWLDARAREGFRIAFPVRKPEGSIQTLSLRYAGSGVPPEAFCKAPSLAGCSTVGVGICRPEIALLAAGDPEFDRDEVAIYEGGTSTLVATQLFDLASVELGTPQVWALGAIGVGSVPAMLRAFAPILRGRVVHLALDADARGEAAIPAAKKAAREAGVRRLTRMPPHRGKDIAEAWSACA